MTLDEYVALAPKAELHVHLEGSIQPATLLALARENGVRLPADSVEGLRAWTRFRDFEHFVEVFIATSRCLRSARDFERAVVGLAQELARQHVLHAEVTVSPTSHVGSGVPLRALLDGLAAGRARAQSEHGVHLAWVFDIVRSHADPAERARRADAAVSIAIDAREAGVVALGLGGLERGYPPEGFAHQFDRARAAGLRSVPHAGELEGPASVRGALDALGADRIGHGVRSVEDQALVERLVREGIVLEVNPTSNLRLGVVRDLAHHPLGRLLAAGVRVVIGTDDPALFDTTLEEEYRLLHGTFGLDVDGIDGCILEGFRASFLPEGEKRAMIARVEAELGRLRSALLGGVSTTGRDSLPGK